MIRTAPDACDAAMVHETRILARVFMFDLLSLVPYYTSELSAALLRRRDVDLQLGAITYYLDRACYRRHGLSFAPWLLDAVSRLPHLPRAVRRVAKTTEYLANLAGLRMRLRSSKPDLIHVQFLPLTLYGSTLELRFLRSLQREGIKVVYTVHNVLPHDASAGLRARYAELYNLADRLICHDLSAHQKLLDEFGQTPQRLSVIAHGPLLSASHETNTEAARKRLGVSGDACLVLWQGILRPYKGVDFLLEAWRQLRTDKPACLAIVGGGDDTIERETRAKVTALNLSASVRLDLRFVSVQELQDYHTAADVLVYPYREVTTSGALMTGASYGKAILASRLPAFEQILHHDQNALLAQYGNTAEWALQLERLIGDRELRVRLGQALRRSAAKSPDWDEIAAQTAACYQSVLLREDSAR